MTDVRSGKIPLLWGTTRERSLSKGFCFNLGHIWHVRFSAEERSCLEGMQHNEKVSESGRRRVREDVVTTNLEKTHRARPRAEKRNKSSLLMLAHKDNYANHLTKGLNSHLLLGKSSGLKRSTRKL